jgi:hypothetical protein
MRTKHILSLLGSFLLIFSILALNVELKKNIKKSSKSSTVPKDTLKNGDLIFQTTLSGQGRAVQLATHSVYTHVGILFEEEGEWMVYEAVQPVRKVRLKQFISNGDSSKYVIKRLVHADSFLNAERLSKMKIFLNAQLNKTYDIVFNWSDEEMYCSELVWKAYQKADYRLCNLKQLKNYDLSHPIVKSTMNQRYGKNIPLNDSMVSPGEIFDSPNLKIVSKNN